MCWPNFLERLSKLIVHPGRVVVILQILLDRLDVGPKRHAEWFDHHHKLFLRLGGDVTIFLLLIITLMALMILAIVRRKNDDMIGDLHFVCPA